MTETTQVVHRFEAAGLGKAPFKYVGCRADSAVMKYTGADGITWETKGGGTCAFCGQYILIMFNIRSSDGREFHVGSDCVERTGDAGLKKVLTVAKKMKSEKAAARRAAKTVEVLEQLEVALADESARTVLADQAHPKLKGLTRLDWAEWMLARAGAKGRAEVAKYLDALLTETT